MAHLVLTGKTACQRRRYYRLSLEPALGATLRWEDTGDVESVLLLDLSEGGCAATLSQEAARRDWLNRRAGLLLLLPDGFTALPVPVDVEVRNTAIWRVGLEFIETPDRPIALLRRRILEFSVGEQRKLLARRVPGSDLTLDR